jgi:hypothetical protein
MPYQASRKSRPENESISQHETEQTTEQLDEHTHGADLLLSLTKKSRIHRLVTPPDGEGANATVPESKNVGDMEPAPAPNQRILYHSPIKVGSTGGLAKKPRIDPNVLLPSELAPYAMVPAWSPSVYNGGMAAPLYPHSMARNHTNASCHRPLEEKKELEVAEEDEDEEDDGKQRLISPSSSNEKLEEEAPTDPPPRWNRWPHAPPHHPMYHPPWPHPGYPMPPPYPPHAYPMYAPYPPPQPPHWAMYGAPPPHAPLYPAYSSRPISGGPSPPSQKTKKTKDVRSRESSPDTTPGTPDESSSLNRCVPLQHPMPKRLWS